MHINYVLWGFSRTGGTVTFTEIGKRLVKKGHRVTITAIDDGQGVMTPNGYKPRWEKDIAIEYIPVPVGNKYWGLLTTVGSRILKPRSAAFEWENINIVSDYVPDCDINVATFFPSAFAVYASGKGKAQFYHLQHYEPLLFDIDNPPKSNILPIRLLTGITNKIAPQSLTETALLKLAKLSIGLPLNRISNSLWLQKTLKEKHNVDSVLINHAIRNEVFYPRPGVNKPANFRVLCLGKTEMFWKGLGTLADALKIVVKKYPDIELVLYGTEKDPKIDFPFRYIFSPSFEELAQLYCSSHLVVCPSWYESFPAPPLEAMSCGVPVVTTSIGTEDYARDGFNSLVVPPRQPEAMADAIMRIIGDDKLAAQLCKNGLETAQEFSWDKTTDKIEKLFLDILK
jgi:glycosyltransferase involved in cell wall biosynthesis